MSAAVEWCVNRADETEITRHLGNCDGDFVPPLSDRVRIGEYAQKIAAHAERFEAWSDGELVGLVAAYCNDREKGIVFVTSVSVQHEWQGKGLASHLMERCVRHAKTSGFRRVELEVDGTNTAAITLYLKQGFRISKVTDGATIMFLDIGKDS